MPVVGLIGTLEESQVMDQSGLEPKALRRGSGFGQDEFSLRKETAKATGVTLPSKNTHAQF